jgi:type III restriction enzyme
MNTIYTIIRTKTENWINLEKDKSQSIIKNIIEHIEKKGHLRQPQKEAIQTYLWLKFVGQNKKLSQLVKEGLLYDDSIAREYDNYYTFQTNYTTQFLNQFFQDNGLDNLHKRLVNDPYGGGIKWEKLLEELLHNFEYPNYLFSLPMGAGKTYLMASFIYLDLYFASLFKNDHRFAHNFVVFAPQATKTAILPSLRTIKDFNPEWILPANVADRLRQIISIDILDSLSSKRKDKLQGNNPNLEKVNRMKQAKNFGLVFITNAEKVVLEKYDSKDEIYVKPESMYYDEKKASEITKINELRESLSQIPKLTVILDEVHHTYGNSGNGEKKLRQAVGVLNQHNNINTVLGLSGTPYVKTKIEIEGETIRLNQIQDIVYNYPLNTGIGKFLKNPDIVKVNIQEEAFIKKALDDFFNTYNIEYKNGTKSKIAFYCPTIKKLNENILPAINDWYSQNRPGKENEIFSYYSDVSKKNSKYALPKENLAIFNNLDRPYSKKRAILLVAVGTEGWDCKSLTSIVLPRQKTTKNFVLQTTCRCLREVDDASKEHALIYLSEDNYETLDKELKDTYKLSISDLRASNGDILQVQVRKPKLGKLKYKQIETRYKIIKTIYPDIKKEFSSFSVDTFKKKYPYDLDVISGKIGREGLTGEKRIEHLKLLDNNAKYSYLDFIYDLAKSTKGLYSETEIINKYNIELYSIFKEIIDNKEWILLHPQIEIKDIIVDIASYFMKKIDYSKESIEKTTEIELLEWEYDNRGISYLNQNGGIYKLFLPRITKQELLGKRGLIKHPEYFEEDYFGKDENIDPQDISFNYVPYKMDSEYERNALESMLKMSELSGYEVYYNGYKDDRLQNFWIQTPRGRYTPDFLILKRESGKKYSKINKAKISKVLILETKGKTYYNEEFRAKEKFIKGDFLKSNPHYNYYCFIDSGENNFEKHLEKFKDILRDF